MNRLCLPLAVLVSLTALVSCGTLFVGGTVAAPTFENLIPDDPSIVYSGTQRLGLKTVTPGALIRYTLDGTVPTPEYGALYDGTWVELTETATVRAIAFKSGWTSSTVTGGTFTIKSAVARPAIYPAGGSYLGSQTVTMVCPTPGATIRYRTDGLTPTQDSGTIYAGPIPVTSTTTFQAIAYRSGWYPSLVTTARIAIGAYSVSMANIAASSFLMGTEDAGTTLDSARPVHRVNLSTFAIGLTEVTQKLYKDVTGVNPSAFASAGWETRPVEKVTWYDAIEFCNALSARDGFDPFYSIGARAPASGYPITSATVAVTDWRGKGYRLPTEAEWEFAAKGGDAGVDSGHLYSGSSTLGDVAWHDGNSGGTTHSVGIPKTANPAVNELGLYDMTGNVAEWCEDWYAGYASAEVTDPHGAGTGTSKAIRGGDWAEKVAGLCRTDYRDFYTPASAPVGGVSTGYIRVGFRVARSLSEPD